MAISIATTSDLESLQKIVVAEGEFTAEHVAPMKQLVTLFRMKIGEKQINWGYYGQATAAALTDGVDMTASQTESNTVVNITTSEVGCKIILSDKLIRQAVDDMFRVAGRQLGEAMGTKLDKDLLALFDGFTTLSLGSTTTTITHSYVTTAITRLKGGLGTSYTDPAPDPIYIVLHPFQGKLLLDDATGLASGLFTYPIPEGPSADILRNYFQGMTKMWSKPLFFDGNLTIDASNDCKGAVFSKAALYLCYQQEWNVERERDASLRAWELNAVSDYGVGELRDQYGVEMYFASTAPTS